MATAGEITSIATAISDESRLVIPTPPIIESAIVFQIQFQPAFQRVLHSLSPGIDHCYLYMFYPPRTWTPEQIAANLLTCVGTAPGPRAYPVPGTDAAAYTIAVDLYKRNAGNYTAALCAIHIITNYLVKAVPDHKVRLIFPRDLCWALNNTAMQIFVAIKEHFLTPTLLDHQVLTSQLAIPFVYIDASSLDKYLAAYCTTILTLELIGATVSPTTQVTTLIQNFNTCADSEVFRFLIQTYQATHTSIESITLASFIIVIQTASSLLIERHSNSQASERVPVFAINAAIASPPAVAAAPHQHYCWSHGSPRFNSHPSSKCPNPKPGHQSTCTKKNRESFPGHYVHVKKPAT